VNVIADAVKVTLGPRGKTVLIGKEMGPPHLTKDGVTVARNVRIKDLVNNAGVDLIRNVASRTCDKAGDGTTTATVLAQYLACEGMKLITDGVNSKEIKRGMETALQVVLADLDKWSIPVETKEDLRRVAFIASNGDEEVADVLSDAFMRVGRKGVVTVEDGPGLGIELELVEGIQFDKGYISPLFMNNIDKGTCEFLNPLIMVYEKPLSTLHPMLGLLNDVAKSTRPLLILADNVDGEALSLLVMNKVNGNLPVAAVAHPYVGERKRVFMEDVAIFTGGQLMNQDLGKKMESLGMSLLGGADKVIISQDKTIIIGGHAVHDKDKKAKLDGRVENIRAQLDDPSFDGDKDFLNQRLGTLTQGVAVVKVGAPTDTEQKERKDRVEDAYYATKGAFESGVVPGGGVALLRAAIPLEMIEYTPDELDFLQGVTLVASSLSCPMYNIIHNIGAGEHQYVEEIVRSVSENSIYSWGYDAKAERECDLIAAGVVDPTKVVKTAITDAVSAAATLLSLEVVIVNEEVEKRPREE